ncbi:MAG: 2OG-Fe(II) oxygenase [Nitrospira sp. SG-bin1]|nr:MAG: 2OG-Fe(II) oxygenase [Nitrospira sp. SG-bin1]
MLFSLSELVEVQGLQYLPDWITTDQEQDLLNHIRTLSFSEVRMHGVTAKRQVVHFGWNYGYDSWQLSPADPIPSWLVSIRERAASLISVPAETVEEVLISRYAQGAGIGWRRDAPMFGPSVVGISLAGVCRMRFQRMIGATRRTTEILLAPRSIYVLAGAARFQWQHSIPPTKELRYSITFRTVRKKP